MSVSGNKPKYTYITFEYHEKTQISFILLRISFSIIFSFPLWAGGGILPPFFLRVTVFPMRRLKVFTDGRARLGMGLRWPSVYSLQFRLRRPRNAGPKCCHYS